MTEPSDQDLYRFISGGPTGFVECLPGMLIASEDDALELVAYCGESGTQHLLVHAENLPAEFFDLHSRLAGNILLKLSNYRIILAAVIPTEKIGTGRFSEMVLETNRGREFRVFNNRDDAVKWLSGL
jgi:PadR family transcriptional regulator AphA